MRRRCTGQPSPRETRVVRGRSAGDGNSGQVMGKVLGRLIRPLTWTNRQLCW